MTPLCQNCTHCRPTRIYHPGEFGGYVELKYETARCALTPDYVTGGSNGRYCSDERANGDCGPEGRNFDYIRPRLTPSKPRMCKGKWWQLFGAGVPCDVETLTCEANEYAPDMESGLQQCKRCGTQRYYNRERAT